MPALFKTMLFWVFVFPVISTFITWSIHRFRGEIHEITYYVPQVLGAATAGIMFGFIFFQIKKLRESV